MHRQVPASRVKEDFGEPAIPLPESSSRVTRRPPRAARFTEAHNMFEEG